MEDYKTFKDFKDDKGKVDWNAYHKHKKQIGEACQECEKIIHVGGVDTPGHPEKCRACREMESDQREVCHQELVRCPACHNHMKTHNGDNCEWLSDGEHEVICDECKFEFEIIAEVTSKFTSPAMLKKED